MARVVRIQSRICVGGPALHSILLAEGLSYGKGARYDTVLMGGALEPGEASMAPFAHERGVSVEIIPELQRAVSPYADARALYKLASRIKTLAPAIVHTHTAKAGAIGRPAARLAGAPIVVHTFHGHVFDGYFHPAKTRAFIAAERALAKITDVILSLSEQQRWDLAYRYRIAPVEKIRVIPLGLELERFVRAEGVTPGAVRRDLGLADNVPIVVAVGRLVSIKRFDLLLEAFPSVLERVPNAHLLIAGDGSEADRRALEQIARPIAERVHFLGWRRDLPQLYADADVLALTSDNEGTPVTVIEALASGLPVVATRVGGVEDVVTSPELGELVTPGDKAGISAALVRALQSPRRLPERVRSEIGARFSHRRLLGDVTALYDRLLAEKKLADLAHGHRAEARAC